MITIETALENVVDDYRDIHEQFEKYGFCLGGNWEYTHGFLDKHLDSERKVWLRVPMHVTSGSLDGEANNCEAVVKLGKPFVFGHLYNEGLSDEASLNVVGGLLNQFQEPVEQDAPVQDRWVQQAEQVIRQVERDLVH